MKRVFYQVDQKNPRGLYLMKLRAHLAQAHDVRRKLMNRLDKILPHALHLISSRMRHLPDHRSMAEHSE